MRYFCNAALASTVVRLADVQGEGNRALLLFGFTSLEGMFREKER
jgi:hypothetical protein